MPPVASPSVTPKVRAPCKDEIRVKLCPILLSSTLASVRPSNFGNSFYSRVIFSLGFERKKHVV